MTLKEQIAKALAAINERKKQMADLMTKAATETGATPDGEAETKIQGLETEIKNLELNLTRLQGLEKSQAEWGENTTPVAGANPEQGLKSTQGNKIEVVSVLPKGVGFAQYARAKLIAQLEAKSGNYITPLQVAKNMHFNDEVQNLIEKATLGTTTNSGFAATLVNENRLVGEFIELLQAASVFDKLQGYRPVPFNSKIPSQLTGGTAAWVGEGAAKPLTNPTFGEVEIK